MPVPFSPFSSSLPRSADARPDVAGIAAKEFDLTEGEGPLDLGVLEVRPPTDPPTRSNR